MSPKYWLWWSSRQPHITRCGHSLPRVMLALGSDGTVGKVNPGTLAELLGHALLVLADAGLFFLEDHGDGWSGRC